MGDGEGSPDMGVWGQDFLAVGDSKGCGIKPSWELPHCTLRRKNRRL